MTNEKALLQLINASIALGAAGRTNIVVQLSLTYLPKNTLEKARDVLGRMRPEEVSEQESVHVASVVVDILGVPGQAVQTTPPPFDPEKLPGGLLHDPPEITGLKGEEKTCDS